MRWFVLLLAVLPACEEDLLPDIDPFPIEVTRDGPLLVDVTGTDFGPAPFLVDTLTPFSVVDTFRPPGTEVPAPARRRMTLDLLSTTGVTRARFRDAAVLDMHTCGYPDTLCRVGIEPTDGPECGSMPGATTVDYQGIIGGDLLSLAALRLNFLEAVPTIRFFPDIAGERAHHCRAGAAVINTPLSGGSTIAIEGGEVRFKGTRLPLNVCVDYDPTSEERASGADMLLLMATGIGPSVIGESSYTRYFQALDAVCAADPSPCDGVVLSPPTEYDLLELVCVQLLSGPTVARVATIQRFAIAGDSDDVRGPCEERRAARLMAAGGCTSGMDCPCENENNLTCRTAAVVELERGTALQVAVLPDSHPMLQALRDELRPGQAEVDGLLGLDGFTAVQIDIDYPGQRILYRCGDDPACVAYTEVFDRNGDDARDRCPDPP